MSDARISIDINDAGGASRSGSTSDGPRPDGELLDRWNRLLEQMERATEAAARSAPTRRRSPAGGTTDPGGTSGPYRERVSRTEQALRNVGPGGRSYTQLAKDALAAGGRPADAGDEEWLWYSRESARRGQAAGRAANRAEEARKRAEAKAERERQKEEARAERERLREEAKAEQKRQADEQRRATWAATAAQGAAASAAGHDGAAQAAGRSVGASAGSVAGEAIGAAVGGPIGAAVGGAIGGAVGGEVGDKIGALIEDPFLETTQALNALTKAAQFAGQSFVRAASNDGIGLLTGATEAAADQLERVPAIGKVLAAEFRLISGSVGAAKAVLDAFAARGRELSGYNSALAGASARQDVALLLADVREANRLGDKMSKVIDAQTKLDLFLREMLLPLKEAIAERLPALIGDGIEVARVTAKIWETFVPGFQRTFGKVSEDIDRMRKKAEEGVAADPWDMWFGGLGDLAGPAAAPFAMDPGRAMPAPVAAPFGAPR